MTAKDPKANLMETIAILESKIDFVLSSLNTRPDKARYMTAQDVEAELGIDQRTILNRSNLPPTDKNHIPSLKIGGRRKYFARKVIERLFSPNV